MERVNALFTNPPNWDDKLRHSLRIKYNNFETEISILKSADELLQIYIPSNDEYDPCLRMYIGSHDGILSAYIDTVGIDDTCLIPKINGGTWIMNFVNWLLCYLGIISASLDDDARLKKCGGSPRLILLRIFQGRLSTWYENFGYTPSFIINQVMKQSPNKQ